MLKLGSLFDGSGGFPLAGSLCGIEPVWASEVEPYPIAVTKSRFPQMKHLGNICNINGAEIEPVDIITFGSPCQDLSVAGKRAGLKHEDNGDGETTRSGLFMEAVRIIKEMRGATNGRYPTFALWENVPGAFSSNKGEDFRIVLEELIKIVEPTAKVPPVPKSGWAYSDIYLGDGWSLAYRVFDAQYWGKTVRDGDTGTILRRGTPQRRRRIHLILDLKGQRAGEVLFKPQGLRGDFAESRAPGQGIATEAENCTRADDREGTQYNNGNTHGVAYALEPGIAAREGGHIYEGVSGTLRANAGDNQMAVAHMVLDDQGGAQINVRTDGKAPTLRAEMHGNVPCVMEAAGFCPEEGAKTRGVGYAEEQAPTLRAGAVPAVCAVYDARGNGDGAVASTITGDHENSITDYTSVIIEPIPIHDQATRFLGKHGERSDGKGNGLGVGNPGDPMNTLTSGDRHAVAFHTYQKVTGPLMANSHPGSYTGQDAFSDMLVAGEEPICLDRAFFNQGQNTQYDPQYYTDGTVPTLVAKGPSAVCHKQEVRYIVRRLTPTECARLQGFPDKWGHPDRKDDFTDEEYAFWTEVRCTHAVINGKEPKVYSREQMLKWYNGLHTDSSEYKMWGNGIALPPALYCMQGMAEALEVAK